jgi:hypothetical protein
MNYEFRYLIESNEENLAYFNKLFTEHESKLREYKESLSNINFKLDELNRTKKIYSINIDFKKSVFSPIKEKHDENNKETKILDEIEKLTSLQDEYEELIDNETSYLKSIARKIKKLVLAKGVIHDIVTGKYTTEEIIKEQKRNPYNITNIGSNSKDSIIDLDEFLKD